MQDSAVPLDGGAGRLMARGATYPRAYRRVRACVFRRMPTRGGTPIMAYPGGHPRAYLDVCVWSVRAYPVLRMVQAHPAVVIWN